MMRNFLSRPSVSVRGLSHVRLSLAAFLSSASFAISISLPLLPLPPHSLPTFFPLDLLFDPFSFPPFSFIDLGQFNDLTIFHSGPVIPTVPLGES